MSGLRWRGSSFVAGSILMVELLCVISRISSANSCRKIPRRDECCQTTYGTVDVGRTAVKNVVYCIGQGCARKTQNTTSHSLTLTVYSCGLPRLTGCE
jgi:hypothetical protein